MEHYRTWWILYRYRWLTQIQRCQQLPTSLFGFVRIISKLLLTLLLNYYRLLMLRNKYISVAKGKDTSPQIFLILRWQHGVSVPCHKCWLKKYITWSNTRTCELYKHIPHKTPFATSGVWYITRNIFHLFIQVQYQNLSNHK